MAGDLTHAARAQALESRLLAQIAVARAMQVRIAAFDGERISLVAPLDPNLNDKGTGFAGSLSTLVTLSGWCLATLLGEADGAPCDAAVFHAELDFVRPVREELRTEAWLADAADGARLRERLAAGRRGKLCIVARLGPADDPAVHFRGDYAVWRSGTQPF